MGKSGTFLTVVAVVAGLLIGSVGAAYLHHQALRESEFRGAMLFSALITPPNEELVGYMVGHNDPLPSVASRCSNCHWQLGSEKKPSAVGSQFGPDLTASHLRETKKRRGGPAFAYDEHSFCRVLRDGLDPTMVIIDQVMPRYRASDLQCKDLWNFLISSR